MNEYLQRLLTTSLNSYSIVVMDSKDLGSKPVTEETIGEYIKRSSAELIILMQIQGRSASFTVIKDNRQDRH